MIQFRVKTVIPMLTAMTAVLWFTITPAVADLSVSGYYDFQTFGSTADSKPIGGLGPLNTNQRFLTGDEQRNDRDRAYWYGLWNEGSFIADDTYSACFDLEFDFNFYETRYKWAMASANFFITFDTDWDLTAPSSNQRVLTSGEPQDAIFGFWRNGRINTSGSYPSLAPGVGVLQGNYGTEFGLRNTIIEYFHVLLSDSSYYDRHTGWIRLYETTNIVEVYFWKNLGFYCYDIDPLNFEVGMEWGPTDAGDTMADEPPTDTSVPTPYNNESWHYGCGITGIGPAVPPHHYRFVPVTYAWDNGTYWPENFEYPIGPYPDWWSIANDEPRANTWAYYSALSGGYGANTTGCLVAESACTKELIATRFIDLTGHPGYPDVQFTHQFQNDGGNNLGEVLLTWTTFDANNNIVQHPWETLWSISGTSTLGTNTVNVDLPLGAFNKERVQVAFKYSRTDYPPPTITSWDMEANPGWTTGGSGDEWIWTANLTSSTLHWGRGAGPDNAPNGGTHFFALDSGSGDNEGAYLPLANTWAQTNVFSCAGYDYVELNYQRWLGVEGYAAGDEALIEISTDGSTWNTVWTSHNEFTHTFIDSEWMEHTIDISTWAANQPTVYLRWRLTSDSDNYIYSGWNLDDVNIRGYGTIGGFWSIDNVAIVEGPTPTPTVTPTPTITPTPTNTNMPTSTPTPTNTPTNTPTPSNTPTATQTNTPTNTWTPSPTPTVTVTGSPTATPTNIPNLDCGSAIDLFCGVPRYSVPSIEGANNVETYTCLPGTIPDLDGNEMVFRFVAPQNTNYTVKVTTANPSNFNLVYMVMESCSEEASCSWTYSNFEQTFFGTSGLDYFVVVDMPAIYETEFTVEMECQGVARLPSTGYGGLAIMIIALGSLLLVSSRRIRKGTNTAG